MFNRKWLVGLVLVILVIYGAVALANGPYNAGSSYQLVSPADGASVASGATLYFRWYGVNGHTGYQIVIHNEDYPMGVNIPMNSIKCSTGSTPLCVMKISTTSYSAYLDHGINEWRVVSPDSTGGTVYDSFVFNYQGK